MLELWEVQRYGSDSYGDADYVSVYGMRPADWYAAGVRLLGRTAVECTRDVLGNAIGKDIAAISARAPRTRGVLVIDPFAGSGNTLYWILRRMLGAGVRDRHNGLRTYEAEPRRSRIARRNPECRLSFWIGANAIDDRSPCRRVRCATLGECSQQNLWFGPAEDYTAGRRDRRRYVRPISRIPAPLRHSGLRNRRSRVSSRAETALRLVNDRPLSPESAGPEPWRSARYQGVGTIGVWLTSV